MNSKRLFIVLVTVIGLTFIGLIAGAYGANSLLSSQAKDLTSLKAKSLALDQERLGLNKAKKDIEKYSTLEKIAKSVVPQDKNQAEAALEINNLAATNTVQLASITFPASTLGTSLKALPNAPSSAAAAPAPAIGNSATSGLSQLLPVKNIPGVYQLPITVTSDPNQPVAYDKFIGFLDALEHNRRTAQVSTIVLQPNTTNRNLLSFTLTLNEYIKP